MPRMTLPPHVHMTVSRGREYFAYHPFRGTTRAGERVKLPGTPQIADGTPNAEWWDAYRRASGQSPHAARAGTFDAAIAEWTNSPEWRELAASTSRNYLRDLGVISRAWGALPVKALAPKHVLELRDTRSSTPAATNNMIACLSSLLSWSIPRGYRDDNPCEHVRRLKGGEPWKAWPWEAIHEFQSLAIPEMRWAASLALYTGQRQGDVLQMGWADINNNTMSVVQEKTGVKVWVPIHRDLRPILGEMPKRSVRILTNTSGIPWTNDGFRASWAKQMKRLAKDGTSAFDDLVFHGLRKSSVVFLLEAGCSTAEVRSVTGQSLQMVERYALDVNKRKLAASAILRWENELAPEFVQQAQILVQRGPAKPD